jgi:hypothetical protein
METENVQDFDEERAACEFDQWVADMEAFVAPLEGVDANGLWVHVFDVERVPGFRE